MCEGGVGQQRGQAWTVTSLIPGKKNCRSDNFFLCVSREQLRLPPLSTDYIGLLSIGLQLRPKDPHK